MLDHSLWREDSPATTNPLKFLWFASRAHWRPIAIAVVMVTIASVLSVSVSYIFKLIANAAAALGSGGSYDALLEAAALYIVIALGAELAWRASGFAGA